MTADPDLWTDLHARMRDFIARRVRDPRDADDLAQDVLLRLHRNLGTLRAGERLDAYAFRTARNAIIDHYRSAGRAREQPVDPLELMGREADPADAPPAHELARCLRPLIDRLPPASREALLLTDLGEVSQVDAAHRLGLSTPGMKSRVQRARTRLHALLTQCCTVQLDRRRGITDVRRAGPCACSAEPGRRKPRWDRGFRTG